MNTLDANPFRAGRPRVVCRVVRQWSALVSERRPGHARSCPDCQAYFQAAERLEDALRCDASELKPAAGASTQDFEQQILRAVRTSSSKSVPSRTGFALPAWIAGVMGAAGAAAAVVLWLGHEPVSRPPSPPLASAATAEDAAIIIKTVESLSTGLVVRVIPSAGELVAENPLQHELGAVYSDMRSALDFLALNFLPATRVDRPPERARSG